MTSFDFSFKPFDGREQHIPAMQRIKVITENASIEFGSSVFPWARAFATWETDEVCLACSTESWWPGFLMNNDIGSDHYGGVVSESGHRYGLRLLHHHGVDCQLLFLPLGPKLRFLHFGEFRILSFDVCHWCCLWEIGGCILYWKKT